MTCTAAVSLSSLSRADGQALCGHLACFIAGKPWKGPESSGKHDRGFWMAERKVIRISLLLNGLEFPRWAALMLHPHNCPLKWGSISSIHLVYIYKQANWCSLVKSDLLYHKTGASWCVMYILWFWVMLEKVKIKFSLMKWQPGLTEQRKMGTWRLILLFLKKKISFSQWI